jgi:hypothetical protein
MEDIKMRNLLVLFCVMALAAPIWGYETIWEGAPDNDIEINLQIDCYIQIDWQDCLIEFDGTSDWWSDQLMGVGYAACPDDGGKFAAEPWAGADYYAGTTGRYYESGDGAVIYVHSNNALSMEVHTNGDLYGTINSASNTIPTWFTVALAPFMIDDVWLTTGTIPGDGQGSYLYDAGGFFGYDNGTYNYPNQYAFPCDPASQTLILGSMAPEVQGTIKFLCRIERHGMADPGDHYYTWLDVTFTTP